MSLSAIADLSTNELNECPLECLLKLSTVLLNVPCSAVAFQSEDRQWNRIIACNGPESQKCTEQFLDRVISNIDDQNPVDSVVVKLNLKNFDVLGLFVIGKEPTRFFNESEKELIEIFKNYIENQLGLLTLRDLSAEQGEVLIQKHRLTTLGQMTSEIIHEINNPLMAIHSRLELLKTQVSHSMLTQEQMIEALGKILLSTERVEHIVKDISAFSHFVEKESFQVIHMAEVIDYSLSFCEERLRAASIKLIQNLVPPHLKINARKIQISQVIINLVCNSISAISDLPNRWIRILVQESERPDYLQIKLIDCGEGIDPQIIDQLFNPYFTTKKNGQGTGLGLSISKNIIESHGGTLTYAAEEPHTTFVIELPRAD